MWTDADGMRTTVLGSSGAGGKAAAARLSYGGGSGGHVGNNGLNVVVNDVLIAECVLIDVELASNSHTDTYSDEIPGLMLRGNATYNIMNVMHGD